MTPANKTIHNSAFGTAWTKNAAHVVPVVCAMKGTSNMLGNIATKCHFNHTWTSQAHISPLINQAMSPNTSICIGKR